MNTIKIIYQRPKRKKVFQEKALSISMSLLGATLISWAVIILVYEIPCMVGKYFEIDSSIIKTALRAEKKITMKYRTKSYAVNKIIHELEEMKEFYSRI